MAACTFGDHGHWEASLLLSVSFPMVAPLGWYLSMNSTGTVHPILLLGLVRSSSFHHGCSSGRFRAISPGRGRAGFSWPRKAPAQSEVGYSWPCGHLSLCCAPHTSTSEISDPSHLQARSWFLDSNFPSHKGLRFSIFQWCSPPASGSLTFHELALAGAMLRLAIPMPRLIMGLTVH